MCSDYGNGLSRLCAIRPGSTLWLSSSRRICERPGSTLRFSCSRREFRLLESRWSNNLSSPSSESYEEIEARGGEWASGRNDRSCFSPLLSVTCISFIVSYVYVPQFVNWVSADDECGNYLPLSAPFFDIIGAFGRLAWVGECSEVSMVTSSVFAICGDECAGIVFNLGGVCC